MDPLQLLELDVLDLARQVAQVLEVLDVAAVLLRLAELGVDDRDLAGLGDAIARALDQRLVDPLLHDLVPDVVGAVHVEALLVEAEADRERRVLDEHQVRRLERHREPVAQLVGPERHAARDHELPEPEGFQIERIEASVLHERCPDVDLVVDAVGLLLLEVVRVHRLGGLLLEVEVGRDRLGDAGHALLEEPPPRVDRAELRVERGAVGRHPLAHRHAELLEGVELTLDVGAEETDDPDLVTRSQVLLDPGDVLVQTVAQLVERGEVAGLVRGLHHVLREVELGQEVGLDGEAPLRRGAADVRERIERIHALEDDRLELDAALRAGLGLLLDALEHGLAEPPLHHRVDRRALLLDDGLDAVVQLLHAPLHRHREER